MSEIINLIIDNDTPDDHDGWAAINLAQTLMEEGELNLLGVMVSNDDTAATLPIRTAAISAIARYHNHQNVPIGLPMLAGASYDSTSLSKLAFQPVGATYNGVYVPGTNAVHTSFTITPEDSRTLYGRLLEASADNSVTILTCG
jgi:hypothetical protein